MLTRCRLSVSRFIFPLLTITVTHLTLAGCQAMLGLSDYDVSAAQPVTTGQVSQTLDCQAHVDCKPTNVAQMPATATYCTSKGRCESLQSEDCTRLAGQESDPDALLIASMFATSGADSAVELARQRAVQLAVEEINEAGGIPAKDGQRARSLLLLACDAGADRGRATSHLASLGAHAILGLSDAEQLFETLRAQLLAANVLTLSTALASESINALLDGDLAWLMALTVEQRAPVLDAALSALQQHLEEGRAEPLKLALLFRDDSAGRAALSALRTHELDGFPLGVPERNAERLRIDRFPDSIADQLALTTAYRGFAPDIIVMIGAVDVLSGFMAPLERSFESEAAGLRPHYLLTEEAKGPALMALARELPSLLERVHGVGAAIPEGSRKASDAFLARYAKRFSADELGAAPRVAAAYDAVYALAYAMAAVESGHELGGRLAQALHALEAPEQAQDVSFDVGPEALARGLDRASSGEGLALFGASSELHWDSYGTLPTGALEAWCLEAASGGPRFGHAPWSFDVAAHSFSDREGSCDGWLKLPSLAKDHESGDADIAMTASVMDAGAAGQGGSAGAAGAPAERSDAGTAAPVAQGSAGAGAEMPQPSELPPSLAYTLKCGQLSCQRDTEQCCVGMLSSIMDDLSCSPRSAPTPLPVAGAAGSGANPRCVFSAQCASDSDCDHGDECCADAQQARCVPAGQCSAEKGRHLACRSAQECPAGQQCCLYGDSTTMSFESSGCAASCGLTKGSVRMCLDDAGCAGDPISSSCNRSTILAFVDVCFL